MKVPSVFEFEVECSRNKLRDAPSIVVVSRDEGAGGSHYFADASEVVGAIGVCACFGAGGEFDSVVVEAFFDGGSINAAALLGDGEAVPEEFAFLGDVVVLIFFGDGDATGEAVVGEVTAGVVRVVDGDEAVEGVPVVGGGAVWAGALDEVAVQIVFEVLDGFVGDGDFIALSRGVFAVVGGGDVDLVGAGGEVEVGLEFGLVAHAGIDVVDGDGAGFVDGAYDVLEGRVGETGGGGASVVPSSGWRGGSVPGSSE